MRRALPALGLASLASCAWWQEPIAPFEPAPVPVEAPAPEAPAPAPIELPGGSTFTPAPAPEPPPAPPATKGDAVIDTVSAGVGALTGNPMLAFALAALAKIASARFRKQGA